MKHFIYGLMTATYAWFAKGSTPFFSLPKQAMEFATNVSKLVDSIPTLITKVDTLTGQLTPLVNASSGSGLFSKVLAAASQFLANFWLPLVLVTTLLGGIVVAYKGLDFIFTCFNAVTRFFGTAGDALSSFFVEGPKEVLRGQIEALINSVKDSLEMNLPETIAQETQKLLTDFLEKSHKELLQMYETHAQTVTNFPQEIKDLLRRGNTSRLALLSVLHQLVSALTGQEPATPGQLPEPTETNTEPTETNTEQPETPRESSSSSAGETVSETPPLDGAHGTTGQARDGRAPTAPHRIGRPNMHGPALGVRPGRQREEPLALPTSSPKEGGCSIHSAREPKKWVVELVAWLLNRWADILVWSSNRWADILAWSANGPFGQLVWVDLLAVLVLWLLWRFVAKRVLRLSGFFKSTYLRVLVWLGRWSGSLGFLGVLVLVLRILSQGFWPGPRKGPGLDWTKIGSLVLVYVVRFAKAWWAASVLQFGLRTVLCSPESASEGSDTEDTEDDRATPPATRPSPMTVLPPENTRDPNMQQRPREPECTQDRNVLGDLLRQRLGNGMRRMAANQVSEQPQSGVQAWAQAVVRAPGGPEAVLAREAYQRNLQSNPNLMRCLEPFARVGAGLNELPGDLLPRIDAGLDELPGDLQRQLRLLYEGARAAAEAGGRAAEGAHTIVHQSFVARAWANLLESLDFLAQTHELNERVNEFGWYLGPLAAVAAGALGYFLFGRSGASAGLPAPSSPPAAPTGPRGPRPAGTAALVTVVRVAEFLLQFFGVTEEGIDEMSNTSP